MNLRGCTFDSYAERHRVQGPIAGVALGIDAAAPLVFPAAWTKDRGASGVGKVVIAAAVLSKFSGAVS